MNVSNPLISAQELSDVLQEMNVRVIDTRWYLKGKIGREEYEEEHIVGASFLDVDVDLSDKGRSGLGRHPLPSAQRFAEALRVVGVRHDTMVVGYDDDGGAKAARLWWLLHYFGHTGGAKVLDGGYQSWKNRGLELSEGPPSCTLNIGLLRLEPSLQRPFQIVDREYVASCIGKKEILILDARAQERYEGISEPIDARAGHIPGAKNAFYGNNLVAPGGAFKPASELRELYESLGASEAEEIIVYCGSGVTACHDILALELAGFSAKVRLYEGSWSDWAAHSHLPIEQGPQSRQR